MDQWKLANKLMVDGFGFDELSSFPIDDVLHAQKFIIGLVTVEDLVRAKEKLSVSSNFKDGFIRHYDDLTMDDFIDGLGRPTKRKGDSNECISYEILGTGNYLEFEFKKQDLYQENSKDQ